MELNIFQSLDFLPAVKTFFKELKVPVNYISDEPTKAKSILEKTYKENDTFNLIDDVYFVGMVDDAAFEKNESIEVEKIKSDYDGILIFALTLNKRDNNLLPTRSQLAEISRAFNREYHYTPAVLVFKYSDNNKEYLAFANTERLKYKQEWREGEKAGKVSLLRDIDISKPHRGHGDILEQLQIITSGKQQVDNFDKLYKYWQDVFSVSVLNKKFYQELQSWYFWALKHVKFPSEPTEKDALDKNQNIEDLIQEHKATNVIRLLTRLLFTWFIKEKGLIPEEIFDLDSLQSEILNEISPFHDENGMFKEGNKDSVYYKAILQNLFFASLNCPINPFGGDTRERGFRKENSNFGTLYLMRYKKYFKKPDAFLQLINSKVPFLNGGLFECLDKRGEKETSKDRLYIDGFSDNLPKKHSLVVPDYLFFGTEEKVDLSKDIGIKNKGTKEAAVKGLINILKSYKFTITENTPIEEDVALDPELLGKVFENLLASYNPETKTTARKQTGSFYTPREIVNYMVDESLIAYLKNGLKEWNIPVEKLDEKLHKLTSYETENPFSDSPDITNVIIACLNEAKILDPACGSGAFPMGILQKMVHILQKLDIDNKIWEEVQKQKVKQEFENVVEINDKQERENKTERN
jgi:adenine-specific DNA-methyltransferase